MNFIANLSNKAKALSLAAILLVVLLIVGLSVYGNVNTINSEGVQQEAALTAQYDDNRQQLSTYTAQFRESLGVADRQSDKLDEILTNAITGRYDNDGGGVDFNSDGALFSSLTEAYPDLTASTESYAKVQDLVISGRDAYANKQTKLLSMLAKYDTWSESGLIKRQVIDGLGFPSKSLRAVDGDGQVHTGEEALTMIRQIVLTQDARDAYDTGTTEPLLDFEDSQE